jgi:Skp family chaperone for outer membrane proteins
MRMSALAILLLLTTLASAQAVAFVNVERVVLEYKKTADISAQLEKRLKDQREQVRRKRQALEQKREALELGDATPLDRLAKERDLALEAVEIELAEKTVLLQQERDLVEHIRKVYVEVRREVAALGTEKGLSAVFLATSGEATGRTRGDLWDSIHRHSVVWHSASADLTDEVIKRLNR